MMDRRAVWLIGGAALALTSSLAYANGPEDLLPPTFREPTQPTPTPTPTTQPRPAPTASGEDTPSPSPAPGSSSRSSGSGTGTFRLPPGFPSLRELDRMEADEINDVLGLRPKFDIPAAARRSVAEVGVLSEGEGGVAAGSLAGQPAALIRAALQASDGPLVSRWGHILLRRVLASRLDAPARMDPVDFAALRARALNGMGESAVARALVQDIDGSEYNAVLADAAMNAYLATGDILGMCPVARLQTDLREDGEWAMLQAICSAYLGESRSANRRLERVLGQGEAEEFDVRLAQRFAGASGESARAIAIEWDGVDSLTRWRHALARAVGLEVPEALLEDGAAWAISDVLIPATPLLERVERSSLAGARGIISAAAMVDLYSQLFASEQYDNAQKAGARRLRTAYAAVAAADRIAAMREIWGEDSSYGNQVLTAYAAARIPARAEFEADAPDLIASMLSAGLDANALRWGSIVNEGSRGWALLALAQPDRSAPVSSGAVDDFIDADDSAGQRKSRFLVAGLAGLGRLDTDDVEDLADQLDINITRESAWSRKIRLAAEAENAGLVALLAGVGMQGADWDRMTARHLYHIVRSLNAVGLSAEARMIAAEAVARG